jgi:hypothetical protein
VAEKDVRQLNCAAKEAELWDKQLDLDRRRSQCRESLRALEQQQAPEYMVKKLKGQLWKLEHTALIHRKFRHNVKTHQCVLTIQQAKLLRSHYVRGEQTMDNPQLLFISDIRTPSAQITEEIVEWDMRVQKAITRALRPFQSSLKFRLPYSDGYCVHRPYLDGKLLYQPFSPKVSHECRLHVGHECNKRHYNRVEFNSKMFRFQTLVRTSIYDQGDELPSAERHPHLVSKRVGTDHCFDCTAARTIARHYAGKTGGDHLEALNGWVGALAATQRACWADGSIQDD